MSEPKDHLDFQYAEVQRLDEQLRLMRQWGVSPTDPGYIALRTAHAQASFKVGLVLPRTSTLVQDLWGFSPGIIRLFNDAELGWMVEARTKPGAQPVYKYVSNEIAEKIVKRQITPELETFLMTPDDYIGE